MAQPSSGLSQGSNSGYFLIKSKLNGLVLDIAGSNPSPNTHVVVHPINGTNGTPNQQWRIKENGLLESKLNGYVLDIPESRKDPFTPLIVHPANGANGTPNQQWIIKENGTIESKLNGLVLDILGSAHEPFTPVVMYPTNGSNGSANQQWELVPVADGATGGFQKKGPVGGTIQAIEFDIKPTKDKSRIKTVRLHCGWAIDKIQVQYESRAIGQPQVYESPAAGGPGGGYAEFSLVPGDYLTGISGTWGREAPNYPKEDIVSLQFKTLKGVKSQVFGGANSQKQVEQFAFEAPPGYEIIGFFGAYGGMYNVLVRLGVYLKPIG